MERDLKSCNVATILRNFNSHAHVERDLRKKLNTYYRLNFNSHAHVERDVAGKEVEYLVGNFNSHAHVERDSDKDGKPRIKKISTHTLTWSVTLTSPL